MAIDNYSDLQTAVGNWLDRTDLSSRIPEFIALAHAKINRRLRVRQQLTTTTLNPSGGIATLPTDYLEWKRVTWEGAVQRALEYVDPDYLITVAADGTPTYFTIEGSNLIVRPADDTSLTLGYYQKIPPLSDSAMTNWLLDEDPDVYLFGALVEAGGFNEHLPAAQAWNGRFELAIQEVERLDRQSKAPASRRVLVPTP